MIELQNDIKYFLDCRYIRKAAFLEKKVEMFEKYKMSILIFKLVLLGES